MMKRARTTIAGVSAAAMLATTSVVAIPAAQAASPGVYGEAPLVLVLDQHTQDGKRERDRRRHRHDYDDDFPAVLFGFGAGAFLGTILAHPHYAEPTYYGDADAYCAAKFKTYKPWTGTYRGYDGYEHPCP